MGEKMLCRNIQMIKSSRLLSKTCECGSPKRWQSSRHKQWYQQVTVVSKTSEKDQWSEGACAWPVQSDMAMLLNAEVFYSFTQLLLRYVKPHTKYSGD